MAEQDSNLLFEAHQYLNDKYRAPNYTFAILYLAIGSLIVYYKLTRSGSEASARYEWLWHRFYYIHSWPFHVLLKLCTSSLKSPPDASGHEKSIGESRLRSFSSYLWFWKSILNHTYLRERWISEQKNTPLGPPGLGNFNNSCFQNAVIQVSIS